MQGPPPARRGLPYTVYESDPMQRLRAVTRGHRFRQKLDEMSLDERALPLIESIYASAIEPGGWNRLAHDLSDAYGRAAVAISMPHPDSELPFDIFPVHLQDEMRPVFLKHLIKGLPWGPPFTGVVKSRFAFASDRLPDAELAKTDFYHEFMQPQGLAPEGPITHEIATTAVGKFAGIVIYRRVGCRPFDADDLALGNLLVPHLERGYAVYSQLGGVRRARIALAEINPALALAGARSLVERAAALSASRSAVTPPSPAWSGSQSALPIGA